MEEHELRLVVGTDHLDYIKGVLERVLHNLQDAAWVDFYEWKAER